MPLAVGLVGFGNAGRTIHAPLIRASGMEIVGVVSSRQDAVRAALTPFHNRRWDADFLTVRRVIEEGVLGPIHTFEARWNRYRPSVPDRWRECPAQGGGVLLDLGTRLLDQALSLFGMPDWLQAGLYSRALALPSKMPLKYEWAAGECGSPPPVLPQDARRVLQVMEAARHSSHSG